jgi:hypothetical protein
VTESDWASCAEPQKMLDFVREGGRASDRKLRLFACACFRRVAHLLADEALRRAVDVAEGFAEGKDQGGMREALRSARAAWQRLRAARDEAYEDRNQAVEVRAADAARLAEARLFGAEAALMADSALMKLVASRLSPDDAAGVAFRAVWAVNTAARQSWCLSRPRVDQERWVSNAAAAERRAQGDLLRDLFGFLFQRTAIVPAWRRRKGLVARLAESVYEERAFDRLPILGDALEDAGCTDANVLGHCRNGGEHVRGCWVVDLLLSKR